MVEGATLCCVACGGGGDALLHVGGEAYYDGNHSKDYVTYDGLHFHEYKMGLLFILAASVGSYIIVKNEGQHDIDINIKEPSSNTDNDKKPLHLIKGAFGQVCNLLC